jgi:hypothetical protein
MKRLGALVILGLVGCGGGGSAESISIGIESHQDRQLVSGTILLAGSAVGGDAEVAVDNGAFQRADGDAQWSIALDTKAWDNGWHVVQARVRSGSDEAVALLNLQSFNVKPATSPAPGPVPPTTPAPIDGTMVGGWSFAGGAGFDVSGNGLDASILGPTAAQGVVGSSLRFDGIDDEVVVTEDAGEPPVALRSLGYGSISIRFRYEPSIPGSESQELMPLFYYGPGKDKTITEGLDFVEIYIGHGEFPDPAKRQIYFTVMRDSSIVLCFDSNPVTLEEGVWYHYVVAIGPTGHRAYLDGEELTLRYNAGTSVFSRGFFHSVEEPELLVFGAAPFGLSRIWYHLHGAIDEVSIHDEVLTRDQAMRLFLDGP